MAWPSVHTPMGGWVISGASANNVSGTAFDLRAAINFAIYEIKCTGNSAIVDLLFSPDGTDWSTAVSTTATNGSTAMLQVSAFYPWINVANRSIFSAAGGSARTYAIYVPGISF